METLFINILFYVFLLLLSGFFSGSETAFFATSSAELASYQKEKKRSLHLIARLMQKPRQLLIVILTGNLFINIFLSTVSNKLAMTLFGPYGPMATIILLTPVIILFAEILPKNLAIAARRNFTTAVVFPIYYFSLLIYPVKALLSGITNIFFRLFRLPEDEDDISKDELATSIKLSQQTGILEKDEGTFLLNLLKSDQREAQNIMVPRNETIFLPYRASWDEARETMLAHGVSLLPIYKNDHDHIKGFVFLKDLVAPHSGIQRIKGISRLIHEAHFFPYRMQLLDLLQEFRRLGIRVAVLLDEYGGTAGIVTLKDIISSIMGYDPHLDPEQKILQINPKSFRLAGDLLLDDLNQHFNTKFLSTQATTLNGFVLENLGKIPQPGDTLILENFRFTVVKAKENRIQEVLFRL